MRIASSMPPSTCLLNAPEALPDHARIERHLEQICDLIYRFDVEKLGAGQTAGTKRPSIRLRSTRSVT